MSLLVPSLLEAKLREFGQESKAYQKAFNSRTLDAHDPTKYHELQKWFKSVGYDVYGSDGLYFLTRPRHHKPIYCHILGSNTAVLNEAIRKLDLIQELGNKVMTAGEIELLADLIDWFRYEGMSIHTHRGGQWVAKCGAAYGRAGNEAVLSTEDIGFTPYTTEFFKSADEAPYLRYQDGRD